jgi:cyanophycinase
MRSCVLVCALWLATPASYADAAASAALRNGSLVIHGGGDSPEPLQEFIRLAGGARSRIIVIPTAAGLDDYGEQFQQNYFRPFRDGGVAHIQLLHTTDRAIADSESFVGPIEVATGVWFTGGRPWRIADAYLDTRTERALWSLLERGGVIGGGSAGASIQGSYLIRGDTRGALIPMGDHQRGFGFLPKSAIDQHFLDRNRHFDMLSVIRAHPELLGIGIDADAGIVVNGDEFRVIGAGYVAIYDPTLIAANGHFYFLAKGHRFQLSTRTPRSAKGEPLWQPQILPVAKLTRKQLKEISGTYAVGEEPIHVVLMGKRILATLCAGDERELIPLSVDVLYDKIDGSRITLRRDRNGAVSGLEWKLEKYAGQRLCREGTVEAVKKTRAMSRRAQ